MKLRAMQSTALVLFALTAGLGLYLFSTRDALPTQLLLERDALLLPAFQAGDVRRLRVQKPNGPRETLLVKPAADGRIDGFHLDSLSGPLAEEARVVAYLEALEYARPVSPAASAATGAVKLEVEIDDLRGKTLLQFFDPRPSDGLVPATRVDSSGKRLGFEVRATLLEALNRPRGHFLSRQLFPFPERATQKLRLVDKTQNLELEAGLNAFFVGGVRADRDLVSGIFFQLARAEMSELLEEQTAEAALGASPVAVEQTALDGELVRVEFGGPCPLEPNTHIVAIRRTGGGLAGCVDTSVLAPLASRASDLQDLHLTSLKGDELDHFVLQNGEQTYDLIRKDDAFELRTRDASSFEPARGERIFRSLAESRGSPLVSPLAQPFVKEGTLRLVGHGSGDVVIDETLEFMSHDAELWVRRTDGVFLSFGDGALSRLVLHPETALADARVLRFPLESVVEIGHHSAHGEFRLSQVQDQFVVSESSEEQGEPVDTEAMEKLMKTLSGLETQSWLSSEEAPKRQGKPQPKPRLELTFKFRTSTSPIGLEVFEHRAGGYRAHVSSEPMDFILKSEDFLQLSRAPLSRQAVLWPETVAGVSVYLDAPHREPTQLRLERQGERWQKLEGSCSLEGEELIALLKTLVPSVARPELRKTWTQWKPRLKIELRSPEGANTELRYFDVPDAQSFESARLIVVSPEHPLPFEVSASSFEQLADAIE